MSEQSPNPKTPWAKSLAFLAAGFILFETLTGLFIYFLPFSISNQIMVLVHTGIGLLFFVPVAWYQLKHAIAYIDRPINDIKITGYIASTAVIMAIISGLILTWQAALGTGISYIWKNIHLISTFVTLLSLTPHILTLVVRNLKAKEKAPIKPHIAGQKKFGFNSIYIVVIQFMLVGLIMVLYQAPELQSTFPEGYSYPHGKDNPFAPSLARTETGGVIDPNLMSGSQSCGSAGCHEQITEEWETSAHRYAAADPFFRKVQETMATEKGAASTRYCAGCHDPISLFSGTKNIQSAELTNQKGLDEGISCVSCHSIKQTDERGNADYTMQAPERYMFEMEEGQTAKWVSDFLIRAYPAQHVKSYDRSMFKSSKFCASCHKQFLDENINGVGWVQLQNQYDPWKESKWHEEGKMEETIQCRECHMPLMSSSDPARGDATDYNRSAGDGKHRSHEFLGANQFVPTVLNLEGAEKHVERVNKWLKGEIEIPEISDKWESGPGVPVKIIPPANIDSDGKVNFSVLITSNKPGHDFPTGPLDIIQAWLKITVTDQEGHVVYTSGHLDDEWFINPGSFIFKAEPVDEYNNLIDRHNLWELVGVRYSRALFPGHSDYAQYSFNMQDSTGNRRASFEVDTLPGDITELHIEAKLQYRKINQFMMKNVFSKILGVPTAPITTISKDSTRIVLAPGLSSKTE